MCSYKKLLLFFILGKASCSKIEIFEGMTFFFLILRVFSMGRGFFSNLDSTLQSSLSNISLISAQISPNFEYVVL